MKTIIKIIKGTVFGLFKIHLWLPLLYTIVFFTVAAAARLEGAWVAYAIGLVVTLLGSVALTYYCSSRKLKKGKYAENKKSSRKEEKRLLAPAAEEPVAGHRPAQGYAPVHAEPPPMYRQPAYDPHYDLYPQGYAAHAQRPMREVGYDPRTRLYENNYENGRVRGYEPGYDPRAQLYGAPPPINNGHPSFTEARQSLYANDVPQGAHPGRTDAAMALYPPQAPGREETERRDASGALYPERAQPGFERHDHASASNALYPESSPMHFGGYDRAPANGALYTNSNQQTDYKTFSPYIQPVNSVLPNREGQQTLYNEPAPAQPDAAKPGNGDGFSSPQPAQPASKISRRREVPLQIYATKADDNTYVYEYADRFEFIKLLEDGNKQLIKTEFKSE